MSSGKFRYFSLRIQRNQTLGGTLPAKSGFLQKINQLIDLQPNNSRTTLIRRIRFTLKIFRSRNSNR